jgi:hypothetical protein
MPYGGDNPLLAEDLTAKYRRIRDPNDFDADGTHTLLHEEHAT